jgi:hypothetical protein
MLCRAIDSVLSQAFSDWELVVSDDEGPGGRSWEILSGYAAADPRIRVLENPHGKGQIENTNNVLLACRGSWIKVLHDDDWLAPESLPTFADAARAHPSAAFITSAANLVMDNGIKDYTPQHRGRISVISSQQTLVDLYLNGTTRDLRIAPSNLLISRAAVAAGCRMRNYGSVRDAVDQLFYLDLARQGDMVTIEEGLVFYDETNHPNITGSAAFPAIDEESLDIKRLNWSMIECKEKLPRPETVVRALRVARLRRRYRKQSWRANVLDAMNIFRPSVLRLIWHAVAARLSYDVRTGPGSKSRRSELIHVENKKSRGIPRL